MSSLLKSPIKNNMHQVPVKMNGHAASGKMNSSGQNNMFTTIGCGSSASGKGIAVMADHTNSMAKAPSAFV